MTSRSCRQGCLSIAISNLHHQPCQACILHTSQPFQRYRSYRNIRTMIVVSSSHASDLYSRAVLHSPHTTVIRTADLLIPQHQWPFFTTIANVEDVRERACMNRAGISCFQVCLLRGDLASCHQPERHQSAFITQYTNIFSHRCGPC